ncbi:hypothetical protein DOT_0866 [Desulfosporosinus sp. OT]|nr:hypothetical protein DOT_0866 [Desulfosporosinus sp. OT]
MRVWSTSARADYGNKHGYYSSHEKDNKCIFHIISPFSKLFAYMVYSTDTREDLLNR